MILARVCVCACVCLRKPSEKVLPAKKASNQGRNEISTKQLSDSIFFPCFSFSPPPPFHFFFAFSPPFTQPRFCNPTPLLTATTIIITKSIATPSTTSSNSSNNRVQPQTIAAAVCRPPISTTSFTIHSQTPRATRHRRPSPPTHSGAAPQSHPPSRPLLP